MMPTINIPPPVGGLNARDAIAAMPPTDALRLVDWIPKSTYVTSAPPVVAHYTPNTRTLTLAPYEAGSTAKLLCVSESSVGSGSWTIYDITSGSATTLKTGRTNGVFVYTMFNSLLVMCNGAETPQVFNGTVCNDIAVTGVTASTLRGVITFKGRAYYWQDNAQSFWYAAAGAYQGALTEFPLSTYSSRGGKVTLLCTITRDGGEGSDDLFVVVLSTGEILVYQGDDPAGAFSWELIGKFDCPKPLGIRSAVRYGRDTLLMTENGIISLTQTLAGEPYPAFSDKVIGLTTLRRDSTPSSEERSLSCGVFSPGLGSIMFLPTNSYRLDNPGSPVPLLIETTTRSWWNYLADDELTNAGCACVWQGQTYIANGAASGVAGTLAVFRLDIYETLPGSNSFVWRSVATSGVAFAVTFNGPTYTDYQDVFYVPYATAKEVGAYVTPWDSMIGQCTAVQTRYELVPTLGGPDAYRWYGTTIRVKSGGRR